MKLLRLCSPFLFFLPLLLQAETIKRIENADGSIEFSNVDALSAEHILIYKSRTGNGLVFSDQRPKHNNFEIVKYTCFACNPDSRMNWRSIDLNTTSYVADINRFARKYDVEPALVRAVIHAESGFDAKALSRKGAQGLMQLMPGTAKDLGVDNAFDVSQNIEGGVKYLSALLKQFEGDIKLATAAYNAGPNAVKKYQGIPPYTETKVYVERVGILHQRYRGES